MLVTCTDPAHDHKMLTWANKCDSCFGTGEVWAGRTQRFGIVSGTEQEVFRAEDVKETP